VLSRSSLCPLLTRYLAPSSTCCFAFARSFFPLLGGCTTAHDDLLL
jgi:hypothetical protein